MDIQDQIAELTRSVETLAKARMLSTRSPSIAQMIGPGPSLDPSRPTSDPTAAHPFLKASLGADYQPGTLVRALMQVHGDPNEFQVGKATLQSLGLSWVEAPFEGKATLGTTGATGGYVLPNNLVDTVLKPNVAEAIYSNLCTVRTNVMVRGVDQPYRTGIPARMTAQNWGDTKTNVSETYGSYTATLGTFAKIMDIGKQYARISAGSAEQDVLDELAKSYRLAENFAVIAGPGTGSATPGINDPTKGLYTSLLGNVYTTTFTGASASTIAGAAASGIAAGIKALSTRNRQPTAVVMDPATYWTIITEGSDTAGFWLDPRASGGFTFNATGGLVLWGVPVVFDSGYDTNTGTTKGAIIGDFSALKLYRGSEFRVDSSDVAGERWDRNEIGFRGEAELGVNADTAVAVGAFQLLANLIP